MNLFNASSRSVKIEVSQSVWVEKMSQKHTSFFYLLFLVIAMGTVAINLLQNEAQESVNIHLSVRNNLWSHYGTKSIKSKIYEVEKNHLNLTMQDITDQSKLSVMNVVMANLDREVSRYKKEQDDIQSEAVKSDTRFEIAKRKHLVLLISLSFSLFSLLSLIGAFLLKLENIFPKLTSVVSFLVALAVSAYGIWFI